MKLAITCACLKSYSDISKPYHACIHCNYFPSDTLPFLSIRTCGNCHTNWCWVCREKGATHSRCPKPLKEAAQTNPRERFKLMSQAVSHVERCEQPHVAIEPFVVHRIRARILQTFFADVASELYIPDLAALPPIILRRRLIANLIPLLPHAFPDAESPVYLPEELLLELFPIASLVEILQLPLKQAAMRLQLPLKTAVRRLRLTSTTLNTTAAPAAAPLPVAPKTPVDT